MDGRRPITVGGGGGYLLTGKGKSQIVGSYFIFLSCFLHGFSQEKALRRRPMRLSFREGGDETETFEEAYGDPIPQNLNFLDQVKSSQVKFLLSAQIKNSPPLVPGAGGLRRRQNLNHPGAR